MSVVIEIFIPSSSSVSTVFLILSSPHTCVLLGHGQRLFFRTRHLTNLISQWDFLSGVKTGTTIYKFFVISSSCDIVILQIGSVLIFGHNSTSWHCVVCRTVISEVVLFFVRFIHWQESPVTIWNMSRVHNGEVRPRLTIKLFFGYWLIW